MTEHLPECPAGVTGCCNAGDECDHACICQALDDCTERLEAQHCLDLLRVQRDWLHIGYEAALHDAAASTVPPVETGNHLPAEPGPHVLECPSNAVKCIGEYCDCDDPHLCVCVYLRAYETRMLATVEAPSKDTLPRDEAVTQASIRAGQAEAFREGHATAVVEFMTNHGDDATFQMAYRQALLDVQKAVTALDPATQTTSKTYHQTPNATKEDT